jgi:hypothetical protein
MSVTQLSVIQDPLKSIQMGDAIVVTLDGGTELIGVIRQFDYDNGNLLLETTAPNSLQLVKHYWYFTKVLP